MISKTFASIILLALFSCKETKQEQPIKDSQGLVEAIYNRHQKAASKFVTFDQKTIYYDTLGNITKDTYWYEAISRPGKLHFRFDDFSSGNGFMYDNGHLYFIKENKITKEKLDKYNIWTVLCHDAYVQSPKETINILKNKLNINLGLFHETTWENRPVYVVGAKKGDFKSDQFWIDKEHLYMVRDISLRNNEKYGDVRYVDYKKVGNEWIEGGLIVFYDKKLYLEEFYENTKTHSSLNMDLFDPKNFSKTTAFFE